MLDIRIFTILVAFVCVKGRSISSDVENNYCYPTDVHPYLNAGTKTAYHHMHGLITNTSVPSCEPVQIWMLARHGTRYPGRKEIKSMKKKLSELQDDIIDNHKKHGRGGLCKESIKMLKKWKVNPDLSKDTQKYLTEQGEEDLKLMGARYKDYFPELLQSNSSKYKFRATNTQRTVASMNSFIEGLIGNESTTDGVIGNTPTIDMEVLESDEDTLLKLYKFCKPWLDEVHSPSTNAEDNDFVNGPVMNETVHEISRRLGFKHDLPYDTVLIMYKACVFERAWFVDKLSPWCAAFTEKSLKVFEYEEDLYYYYHSSYGQNMSNKVGCTTLQDMFEHFTKLEEGDTKNEPQGIFYFSHSTSLQLLFTTMGIAKDTTPLKAGNYESMVDSRKWRTSYLVPFAANIAAVFYRCDSSNKVRFYLNEKPLDVEGCDGSVCDWKYLKEKLGDAAFSCNVDFCRR
ncbi:multiple inositol polyphosphate phosphatase 1-like [Hylaeus anthracinus]|uniref:multiple inositol polyphosphate phosphatase 1-like n=1 Tax=Hylaeus anthracinus TaxID=313031 RepID=UPI0023B9B010|nr:multiple inositol polyphosphate phosphatase 1-like [Hylaeus anthracinus]XP_053996570.1 multiple inositol polyphosphate phosphatase 1-like [Hylaeus anthracinus]